MWFRSFCGCSEDLVHNDVNGYAFDPYNKIDLAEKFNHLFEEANKRKEMGVMSGKLITAWGPDRFAKNMIKALVYARQQPRPKEKIMHNVLINLLIKLNKPRKELNYG